MRRRTRLGLLFSLATLLAGSTPLGVARAQSSVVRMAITQNEKNWTPYTYQTGDPGYNVLTLLFDTLLWHDKDNKITPWLAKEYKVSPDGLTVDVTLHDNVKWSDGRPLTAEDVKFTYDYIQEFNHGRFTLRLKGIVVTTTVVSPNRVTFRLSQPSLSFPVSMADVTIMPKHVWEDIREAYPSVKGEQGLAVGSGPYRMVEYTPDKQYRLMANPEYFMGKPAVNELVLPIIPDSSAQVLALRSGEVDAVAANLSPELVKELGSAPGLKVLTGPGYTTSALTFNTTRPPMEQTRFRQAVANAIDVNALVDQVLAGVGTPGAPGYIHPDNPLVKQGLRHEFNLAKANTTLDELGFRDKESDGTRRSADGKRLQFEMLANSANPIEVRTAEVIGSMLSKAGIRTSVVALTGTAKAARTGGFGGQIPERDFDMQMTGLSAPAQDDPPTGLRAILESWTPTAPNVNSGKWSNAQFDAVLKAESTELDPAKRAQQIEQMQEIIATDRPTVVLFYRNGGYGTRTAAYGGWAYVRGKGIVDKLSFVAPAESAGGSATTVASRRTNGEESGPSPVIFVVVLAVIAGAAGLALARSRRARAESE